jgi:solute carrier family 25 (mitochondrial citrate transporter), member 1
MEVVKIRLQAQTHSLSDPLETPRYRNAGHAVYTIIREEGIMALYRGVSLTALRQATNQGHLPPLPSEPMHRYLIEFF